jgi:hypothetical protein
VKKISVVGLLLSSLLLAGCTQSQTNTSSQTTSSTPTETQKTGDTTKTGKITQISDKFFLEQPGKQPMQIDSYKVDLKTYIGKTVKITGQYSGDTLFVGSIE